MALTGMSDRQGRERRVSQQDIAREAQVSRVTVSLVLAGKDETNPETRQRVLEAAERLKYRPNLLVKGMKTGRTGFIGVIAPVAVPFHAQIVHGIHDTLIGAECVPLLLWADTSETGKTTELEQIHRLTDRRVDGIIIWPLDASVPDVHFREIWERNIPLVTVDRETTTHADHVGTDEELGGRLVAEHLLSLGHRHVAHLTYPVRPGSIARRRQAFCDAIVAGGGKCDVFEGEPAQLSQRAVDMLAVSKLPTAVFAATDALAMKVYSAAARRGLRIPDDLSVVGYADFSFAAELVPPLTTVRQDPYAIGQTAAQMLLQRLADGLGEKPQRVYLTPSLIVRQSTRRI